MNTIYTMGRGGKHRNNAQAATWRTATARAAELIRAAYPSMYTDMVLEHAELEIERAFRLANYAERPRTEA